MSKLESWNCGMSRREIKIEKKKKNRTVLYYHSLYHISSAIKTRTVLYYHSLYHISSAIKSALIII